MRGPLLAWVVITLLAVASARDIHVTNISGDDRFDGAASQDAAQFSGPVRTISKALRLAQPGDRILVANTPEPYRETISVIGNRRSGSPMGPLVIEGNGALLDGSQAIPAGQWKHVAGDVFSYEPRRKGYQQLFLEGRAATRRQASGPDSGPPDLQSREWCFLQGKIYLCVDPGRQPEDYAPACCALTTGISLYYVEDVVIRNFVIDGFQTAGVIVDDVARKTRFEKITCRSCGHSGFWARGASEVELDQCDFSGSGEAQFVVDASAKCRLYKCRVGDGAPDAIWRRGGELFIDDRPYLRQALEPARLK